MCCLWPLGWPLPSVCQACFFVRLTAGDMYWIMWTRNIPCPVETKDSCDIWLRRNLRICKHVAEPCVALIASLKRTLLPVRSCWKDAGAFCNYAVVQLPSFQCWLAAVLSGGFRAKGFSEIASWLNISLCYYCTIIKAFNFHQCRHLSVHSQQQEGATNLSWVEFCHHSSALRNIVIRVTPPEPAAHV